LAHRFDGRIVFVAGAVAMPLCMVAARWGDPLSSRFLLGYWLLGIGLGFLYPPLIGWPESGRGCSCKPPRCQPHASPVLRSVERRYDVRPTDFRHAVSVGEGWVYGVVLLPPW